MSEIGSWLHFNMVFVVAVLLVVGTFSSRITSRFGVPVLLLFLGLGMLAGSDCLGLIDFDNAELTQHLANLALMFILFDSGFCTKRAHLKSSFGPSLSLATVGILITAGSLGLLIHLIARVELGYALMLGAIVSSTDAAAVIAILRQNPVKQNVATTLEVESAANDPMAILLTIAMIELLGGSGADIGKFLLNLGWQLTGGIIIGWVLSRAGVWLFNNLRSENKGYYYVLLIGMVLLSFGLSDLLKASGIIAVFFCGYWMGNTEFVYKNGVAHFIEGLSSFGNMGLFLLLGLLVFPAQLPAVWKEGLLVALAMIFVARPLAVWLCTLPFPFRQRERLFIAWGGIKGAVPIVLATYPAVYGLDKNNYIFNIVFFVVFASCLLQGATLNWVAKLLKLQAPAKPKRVHSLEMLSLEKAEIDMFEFVLEEGTRVLGRKIKELPLPHDTHISSIIRGNKVVTPRGDTVFEKGDTLFVLARTNRQEQLHELFY